MPVAASVPLSCPLTSNCCSPLEFLPVLPIEASVMRPLVTTWLSADRHASMTPSSSSSDTELAEELDELDEGLGLEVGWGLRDGVGLLDGVGLYVEVGDGELERSEDEEPDVAAEYRKRTMMPPIRVMTNTPPMMAAISPPLDLRGAGPIGAPP